MGFFTRGHKTDYNEDTDDDDDIEEFNSLFDFNALDFQDEDDTGDTAVGRSPENQSNQYSSDQNLIVTGEDSQFQNSDRVVQTGPDTGITEKEPANEDQERKNTLAVIWNNRGVVLSRLGRYDESIEAYDQALQLDPGYQTAWNNKGVALSKSGRYTEALEAYDRALRIIPEYPVRYKTQAA